MDFLLKSVLSVHWVLCGHDTWNPPRPWKEAGPKDFQTMKKSAVEDQGGKSTKGYQTFYFIDPSKGFCSNMILQILRF